MAWQAAPACCCMRTRPSSLATLLVSAAATGVESATHGLCACCDKNRAKGKCPNAACGFCCVHANAHTLQPAAHDRRRAAPARRAAAEKRLAEAWRAKALRLEEKARRRAALAAAHAKARTRGVAHTASPLLALPDGLLDAVVLALGREDLKEGGRLACVHSALLGAYGRVFRVYGDFGQLYTALDAAPPPPSPSPLVVVRFADLEEWHAPLRPLPPLTLQHARVCGITYGHGEGVDALEAGIEEFNASVTLIHELEVDYCGALALHVPDLPEPDDECMCPRCFVAECDCLVSETDIATLEQQAQAAMREHEAEVQRLEDTALAESYAEAEQDARDTLDYLRDEGLTMPVRKLSFRASFTRDRMAAGFYGDMYESECVHDVSREQVKEV